MFGLGHSYIPTYTSMVGNTQECTDNEHALTIGQTNTNTTQSQNVWWVL